MKNILLLCMVLFVSQASSAQDKPRPTVSEKPFSMMQKLGILEGSWTMVTQTTNDAGKTWQTAPPANVHIHLRHKGLMLAEIPADTSQPGFHMETYITYDQYRGVYRKAAVDDVWGIMDIYEGTLQHNALVLTNLKSETTFPIGEGKWRNFKLTMELKEPVRQLNVEKSDDGGTTWQPAFRITYSRQLRK